MFLDSGVRCGHSAGVVAVVDGHHPGAMKGTIMEILVVAIVAIVSFGLYRYMRTRTAH
jgi:hypothetical protein